MSDWSRVKWSEARQVLEILRQGKAAALDDATLPPDVYFAKLRESGRLEDAVKFMSQCLPRLESVAWAARVVRDLTPPDADRSSPEARALRAALLWISDPTEPRRRAAHDAGDAAEGGSPEHLAAMATFFSGGSIAPETSGSVPSPRDAAGRFAAAAVILAASRTPDRTKALDMALDAGVQIARHGLEPVSA
jgi:hypothetical protein